jgi:hypothetical protein
MQAEQEELIQQLQAQVQALEDAAVAAAAAAAGPAPPGGVPPVPPPVFTLAPALANTAAFLDLTSTSGAKHFKGATEPLTAKPFDFSDPSDLQVFLDLLLKKSQVYGWNPVLTIPVTDAATNITTHYNLLSQYGLIPLASIRAHVFSYYGTQTKQAQDSFMVCQSLLSSLSVDFLKLITADSQHYHLPAIVVADGPIPAGPLLLKVIISKAHVDSRATITFIRTSLTLLDDKMIEVDSNIKVFNFFVKAQLRKLAARGETTQDLLINLFKGYKVADDAEFLDFIRRKENAYEEGHDVDTDNLMADAESKFDSRTMTGKWSAPTKEQGQILALTAQVEQLKSIKSKSRTAKAEPGTGAGNGNGAGKPLKRKGSEWAWKDIMPKEGEPTTKDFKGKHYHIACKFHKDRWVCHTSEECSKNPANSASASSASADPVVTGTPPPASSRRLRAAQLAAALLQEEEETGGESDGTDL